MVLLSLALSFLRSYPFLIPMLQRQKNYLPSFSCWHFHTYSSSACYRKTLQLSSTCFHWPHLFIFLHNLAFLIFPSLSEYLLLCNKDLSFICHCLMSHFGIPLIKHVFCFLLGNSFAISVLYLYTDNRFSERFCHPALLIQKTLIKALSVKDISHIMGSVCK